MNRSMDTKSKADENSTSVAMSHTIEEANLNLERVVEHTAIAASEKTLQDYRERETDINNPSVLKETLEALGDEDREIAIKKYRSEFETNAEKAKIEKDLIARTLDSNLDTQKEIRESLLKPKYLGGFLMVILVFSLISFLYANSFAGLMFLIFGAVCLFMLLNPSANIISGLFGGIGKNLLKK